MSLTRRTRLLTLCFATCLTVAAAVADRDTDQDRRLEAVAERLKRLEALLGVDENPVPGKPTVGQRLDRLERESRATATPAESPRFDPRPELERLGQSVRDTDRQVQLLARRVEQVERQPDPAATSARLERDIERLQRELFDLRDGLRRVELRR
jgi:hypothetical protein